MSEIVVGVDGSIPSRAALRWAVEQARLTGLPLRAVYAYSTPVRTIAAPAAPPASEELRDAAAERLAEVVTEEARDEPVRTEVLLVREGNVAHRLCDVARNAALLVVGSRGLGGFTGLLVGSVSQQCVQYATCPVVVVRAVEREAA